MTGNNLSDEPQICVGEVDDARIFVWCRSTETYEDECLKKINTFPESVIQVCMSGNGAGIWQPLTVLLVC